MHKLIEASVFAAIGVLVFASLLIPVVDDATATTDTFNNEGYFYMEKITADDDRTLTAHWEKASPYEFVWNDTTVNISTWATGGYTIITDGVSKIVRLGTGPNVGLQTMGNSFGSGGGNTTAMDITISGGTITADSTTTTSQTVSVSATYTELWVYSLTPTDYVMKKADKIAYLNEDSEYLAMGVTTVTQWNTIIKVTGTVNDFDVAIVYPDGVTATTTNKDVVIVENTGYLDLYELDKLTFTVSDGTNTVNAVYSYFIVPATVTAEKAIHADEPTREVLEIMPLILIAGLIIGVLGYVVYSRIE